MYMKAPELARILENNAGLEFLTKTREVRVRRLLSANAHGYPVPPLAIEYIKQHHMAYLTGEAHTQFKEADLYVRSAPTHEDDDQSHSSDDISTRRNNRRVSTENPTPRDLVRTSCASSSLQQRIVKRPKFCSEEINRTSHPEVDAKGKPKTPATYPEFISEDDRKLLEDSATPEDYKALLKIMEVVYEVNSSPCYDAEALALGSLMKAEYFLLEIITSPTPVRCRVLRIVYVGS
jgi:hypothetical protein